MRIFLDTSSLVKLYCNEPDTTIIEQLLAVNKVSAIYISNHAVLEFISAIWKKVRMKEMDSTLAENLIEIFTKNLNRYEIINFNEIMYQQSIQLLGKYGKHGLRTLDSIQLSNAIAVKDIVNLFVTSDKLLLYFFKQENLPV